MAKKSFTANMPTDLFITEQEQKPVQAPDQEEQYLGSVSAPDGFKLNREFIETKSRRVQLLMQPTLYGKLKSKAEESGLTFNDFVHKALEKLVD